MALIFAVTASSAPREGAGYGPQRLLAAVNWAGEFDASRASGVIGETLAKSMSSPTEKRRRDRIASALVPPGALALALATVVAAYLISFTSSPRIPTSASPLVGTATGLSTTPTLYGGFGREAGPEGTVGQWIGDEASIGSIGIASSWIAFRALSLRIPRTLTFSGVAGRSVAVRIRTRPAVYVVGPLTGGSLLLRPTPGSARASHSDPRRLSIFLSMIRAFPRPVAAIPGGGFWPTERAGGVTFNWLRNTGVIDVAAPHMGSNAVWLEFVVRSLQQPRTLTGTSTGAAHRLAVGTAAQAARLGPFPLARGRARIFLSAFPGPQSLRPDPRALSVQVAALSAEVVKRHAPRGSS